MYYVSRVSKELRVTEAIFVLHVIYGCTKLASNMFGNGSLGRLIDCEWLAT